MSETQKVEVEVQSQPKELGTGEQLKNQRKARGISLVEVTEHTKIGKKYLEALEEEMYDFLPSPAYIQGFLRAYAKYLEMDDGKLVRQYQAKYLAEKKESRENSESEQMEKQNNQSIWAPLLAMIILAGLGAGLFLLWPLGPPERIVQDAVLPSSMTEGLEQTMPPATGTNDVLTLKIRAKEKTWITIMIDGKQEPDVTLAANEARQWYAKERFVLWTGNAGGIEVYFNGNLQPALGSQGEVRKEIIFERKKPVVQPEEELEG